MNIIERLYYENLKALKEAHKLLKHYANQLNIYDEGKREIPDHLEDWIIKINYPERYKKMMEDFEQECERSLNDT